MENLAFLMEYHLWAHHKVLQQVSSVPAEDWNTNTGGSFPSLRALFQHLLEVDYRWLQRWKGIPFAQIPQGFVVDGYSSLNAMWPPQLDEMMMVALPARGSMSRNLSGRRFTRSLTMALIIGAKSPICCEY